MARELPIRPEVEEDLVVEESAQVQIKAPGDLVQEDVEMMEDDENDNGNEDNVCGQSDSSSDEEVINSIVGYSSSDSDFENILVQPANEPSSRYGRRRKDYRKEGCISWDNIQLIA